MKKTKLKKLLFTILFLNTLQFFAIQQQDSINPYFKEVVNNIKIIKSGFPKASTDENEYLKNDNDISTIVGLELNSKDLRRILKDTEGRILLKPQPIDYKSNNYKWRNNNIPILKKLKIYCEKLTLNEDLWVPEADIEINAKIIDFAEYKINTSPLPWEENKNPKKISKAKGTKGKDGLNGGNITLNTETIISKTNLITAGSNGTNILAPELNINWPKNERSRKIHMFEGSGKKIRKKINSTRRFDHDIIGYSCTYFDQVCKFLSFRNGQYDTYEGFISVDDKIQISKNNETLKIIDKLEGKRISDTETYKPGKGGNGGNIKVFYPNSTPTPDTLHHFSSGKSGYYINRKEEYKEWEKTTPLKDYSWETKEYRIGHISFFDGCVGEDYSSKASDQIFKFPNYLEELKRYDYNFTAPNKKAKDGKIEYIKKNNYIPHPKFLSLKARKLENSYFVYNQLSPTEQEALNQETNRFLNSTDQLLNNAENLTLSIQTINVLKNIYSQIIKYKVHKQKNIDQFGNGPGYRPILEIDQILSYVNENFENDIRLFVQSDLMAKSEMKQGDFIKKIPTMINSLEKVNKILAREKDEINNQFSDLSTKAKDCEEKTKSIKKSLVEKEIELINKLQKEAKKLKIVKASLKTLAVAASVIPYGQPILGQVVTGPLNSIADNLNEDPSQIAFSAMKEIDMSGVMNKLAERKIKPIKDKQSKIKQIELEAIFETQGDPSNKIREIKIANNMKSINGQEKKLNKLKDTYNKRANALSKVIQNYGEVATDKTDISAELNSIMANSSEFRYLHDDLKSQLELRTEILNISFRNLQRLIEIEAKLNQNLDNIKNLKILQINPTSYNKEIEGDFFKISTAARERLQKMEYELIKAYEYSVLEKYEISQSCDEILATLYEREKGIANSKEIDELISNLSIAYKASLQKIKNDLLTKTKNSHKEDAKIEGKNYGRKFKLSTTTHPKLIASLNNNKFGYIDLQRDLIDNIIKPREENVRIIDISLDSITFTEPLPDGVEIDLTVELDEDGVLRKGKQFYAFHINKEDEGIDQWKWTINNDNDITNESKVSTKALSLVKYITGKNDSNTGYDQQVFALPPAMTNLLINYEFEGIDDDITTKIKQLNFSVRCSYNAITLKSKKNVLDVKFHEGGIGTQCKILINGNPIDEKHEYRNTNYYGVYDNNPQITLEIPDYKDSNGKSISDKKFIKWSIYPAQNLTKEQLKDRIIKFKLNKNTRVKALFEDKI